MSAQTHLYFKIMFLEVFLQRRKNTAEMSVLCKFGQCHEPRYYWSGENKFEIWNLALTGPTPLQLSSFFVEIFSLIFTQTA